MKLDKTTIETLEFPSVLDALSTHAMTEMGKALALGLAPSGALSSIRADYAAYSEIAEIVKVSGTLPVGGASDIRPLLSRLEPEGAFILPEEALIVKANIESAGLLKSLASDRFGKEYPITAESLSALSAQGALLREIDRVVNEKGEIRDDASPALWRIRKEIRGSRDRARTILDSLTGDKRFQEYLQDDYVTIRDDRYVLSIKTGMHVNVPGIIHGRSGSGATYFIEPFQIVELNNRIAVMRKDEKAEEIEILKKLTAQILIQREALLNDQGIIGLIDFIQSKALFGARIGAVVPELSEGGTVSFIGARHPLLALNETAGGASVIPVDISIPEGTSVLVISGANTGGKTVALKTLGILTLMALSALPLPVREGSKAAAFETVFSDIGDRQDIIASLSTFSAHVKRMKEFLSEAGPGALVLIDEIGAGTDPSEGSAFALAAIETLREAGAVTAVTTHLNLLKARAQTDAGYLNASVEFDETTLRPLYRLRYGIPGPSLGLSIAESLGIPARVIERARSYITEREGAFIESVRILEEKKEEAERLSLRLKELEEKRAKAVDKIRTERARIVDRARAQVETLVAEAKADALRAIEEIRRERSISAAKAGEKIEGAVFRVIEKLKPAAKVEEAYIPEPGERVTIAGSNATGEVVRVDAEGKRAEVSTGKLKVWLAWDKIKRKGGAKPKAVKASTTSADVEVTSTRLNLLGLRVEEALPLVERLLDSAHAGGITEVDIIHGIGTGRLAKAVEEYLKKSPVVKSYRTAEPSRGGGGVTVVELK